jgi:hypothetical protein
LAAFSKHWKIRKTFLKNLLEIGTMPCDGK